MAQRRKSLPAGSIYPGGEYYDGSGKNWLYLGYGAITITSNKEFRIALRDKLRLSYSEKGYIYICPEYITHYENISDIIGHTLILFGARTIDYVSGRITTPSQILTIRNAKRRFYDKGKIYEIPRTISYNFCKYSYISLMQEKRIRGLDTYYYAAKENIPNDATIHIEQEYRITFERAD